MAKKSGLQFDFDEYGMTFLAGHLHRLRILISAQSDAVFHEFDIDIPSHCASLILLIEQHKRAPVMAMADALGYSHQLIIQRLAILEKQKCILKYQDDVDRRRSIVTLTKRGRGQAKKVSSALVVINSGIRDLFSESGVNLQQSVRKARQLLLAHSLSERGHARGKAAVQRGRAAKH